MHITHHSSICCMRSSLPPIALHAWLLCIQGFATFSISLKRFRYFCLLPEQQFYSTNSLFVRLLHLLLRLVLVGRHISYYEIFNSHIGRFFPFNVSHLWLAQVLFVLHEKNIPCTLYEVDVANGEQFSDWFIHMNPKLDIPVLQNGPLIVPSSNQIICYLDANFNDGECIRKRRRHVIPWLRLISDDKQLELSIADSYGPRWTWLVSGGQCQAAQRNCLVKSEDQSLTHWHHQLGHIHSLEHR